MKSVKASSLTEILVVLSIVGIVLCLILGGPLLGTFPFGPSRTVIAKVERLYVDYSGGKDSSSSHYMVGTDQGVFECDNSLWLGLWDADERYASLKQGDTYELKVKGRKVINFFIQEYPGIVEVKKAQGL